MMLDSDLMGPKIGLLLPSSVMVTSLSCLSAAGVLPAPAAPFPGQPADHSADQGGADIDHAQPCHLPITNQGAGAASFLRGRSVSPASPEASTGNRR
jgi:hypothetical protein